MILTISIKDRVLRTPKVCSLSLLIDTVCESAFWKQKTARHFLAAERQRNSAKRGTKDNLGILRVSVPRAALTKLVSWSLCALSVLSLPDLRTVSLWFRKTLWRKPRDTYIYFLLNLCCFLGIHVNAEWFDKCLWFIHPVMHGFSFFSKVLYLLIDEWLFKWIWENWYVLEV